MVICYGFIFKRNTEVKSWKAFQKNIWMKHQEIFWKNSWGWSMKKPFKRILKEICWGLEDTMRQIVLNGLLLEIIFWNGALFKLIPPWSCFSGECMEEENHHSYWRVWAGVDTWHGTSQLNWRFVSSRAPQLFQGCRHAWRQQEQHLNRRLH